MTLLINQSLKRSAAIFTAKRSGLYYLQSRYYNPEWGRFINADALVSTGQGILGNNMFAYCNNNPVNCSDPNGMCTVCAPSRIKNSPMATSMCGCGGAGGGGALLIGSMWTSSILSRLENLVETTRYRFNELKNEVYEYNRKLRQELVYYSESMPHVHHIVPVGSFMSRNPTTQMQIGKMHTMLKNAGISVYFDPVNLVPVSAKTHASLHTDAYIAHVYSYIMATDGSKEGIYSALFYLRLEIAAMDTYALGY